MPMKEVKVATLLAEFEANTFLEYQSSSIKVTIPLDAPFLHTILTLIKRPALMYVCM